MAYGSDFRGVDDIDFGLSAVDGREALIEAIARRYLSPRGGHRYARDYGLDLRNYLADTAPLAVAQSAIAAEARKDERIRTASAVITDTEPQSATEPITRTVRINVAPRDESDPFELTFQVSADSVVLLTGDA